MIRFWCPVLIFLSTACAADINLPPLVVYTSRNEVTETSGHLRILGPVFESYEKKAPLSPPSVRCGARKPTGYLRHGCAVAAVQPGPEKSDKGPIGRLMDDDGRFFENLNSTLKNLDEITALMNSSRGTLGKLLKEDTLYVEMTATVKKVNDFREMAPVATFGSILLGAF